MGTKGALLLRKAKRQGREIKLEEGGRNYERFGRQERRGEETVEEGWRRKGGLGVRWA